MNNQSLLLAAFVTSALPGHQLDWLQGQSESAPNQHSIKEGWMINGQENSFLLGPSSLANHGS
jgi:hypothetical protein